MRGVWLAGGVALALLVGIAVYLAPLQPGALALQGAYTPAAFGTIVHSWSADELARYRAHLWWDYALLAAYGAFGALIATRTRVFAALSPGLRRLARAALPFAAVCDAAENTLHLWLTEAPRFGVPQLYATAASCAVAKWLAIVAFAALTAWALACRDD